MKHEKHGKKEVIKNESEVPFAVDSSGASNVGSVFRTGLLVAVCAGAALLAAAIGITILLLKEKLQNQQRYRKKTSISLLRKER